MTNDYTDSTDGNITYKRIQDRALEDAKERMPDLPKLPERQLYADSARGVYIPQHFAESVDWNSCDNWDEDQRDILLAGPEHEQYWDVWVEILDNVTLSGGYTLHQDGDLWLVPVNAVDAWETFISDLEDLDAHEIAHECSGWDWVIYYARALELCQAVPSSVLHEAESQWGDLFADGLDLDTFGLYEMACQLAAIIVTDEIVQAVETVRDELLEMAENQLENL